jgi:hypothetical protein
MGTQLDGYAELLAFLEGEHKRLNSFKEPFSIRRFSSALNDVCKKFSLPSDTLVRYHTDETFDIGGVTSSVKSYRGYYDELMLEVGEPASVDSVISSLNSSVGAVFEGYKGGEYKMLSYSNVWLDTYGNTLQVAPYDVVYKYGHLVVLAYQF